MDLTERRKTMSIDGVDREAVFARLASGTDEEDTDTSVVPEVEVADNTDSVLSDTNISEATDPDDVTEGADPTNEGDDGHSHDVPYKRFKSVVAARNEAKSQLKELQDKLAAYEANPPSTQDEPSAEDAELDALLASFEEELPTDDRYSVLESRIQAFEVEKQSNEILSNWSRSIDSAVEKYAINRDVLVNAVVDNHDLDIESFAEQYSTFMAQVEEQAIAKYVGRSGDTSSHPVPSRPRSSGSKPSAGVTTNGQRPKTLADAKKAALAFLRNNT